MHERIWVVVVKIAQIGHFSSVLWILVLILLNKCKCFTQKLRYGLSRDFKIYFTFSIEFWILQPNFIFTSQLVPYKYLSTNSQIAWDYSRSYAKNCSGKLASCIGQFFSNILWNSISIFFGECKDFLTNLWMDQLEISKFNSTKFYILQPHFIFIDRFGSLVIKPPSYKIHCFLFLKWETFFQITLMNKFQTGL